MYKRQVVDGRRAQLLSKLYDEFNGQIPSDYLQKYADYFSRIGDISSAGKAFGEFFKNYVTTMAKIHADESKPRDKLKEIDRELLELLRQTQTTIKMNELVIKPETFDGERPKPRRWIQDYNEAILANGWSDQLAVKYLPMFLSKSAKDWYFTDVKPGLKKNALWHEVHAAFMENYLSEADYEQLSITIENARQKPNESVSNFIPRMRRMLLLLTPNLPREYQLRQLKIKLRPEYKQLLAFSNPQPSDR